MLLVTVLYYLVTRKGQQKNLITPIKNDFPKKSLLNKPIE